MPVQIVEAAVDVGALPLVSIVEGDFLAVGK
jgi:hypothetical protein